MLDLKYKFILVSRMTVKVIGIMWLMWLKDNLIRIECDDKMVI